MSSGSTLYYVQDREVHAVDLERSLRGNQIASCRRPDNAMTSGMKSLQFNAYNPSKVNLLVFYTPDNRAENGCYDLFVGGPENTNISPLQGNAQAVAFTAR